jgi:hypothetical protein
VRQLERKLERYHPTNRGLVQAELQQARRGKGPTVFDQLMEIVRAAGLWGVRLDLRWRDKLTVFVHSVAARTHTERCPR